MIDNTSLKKSRKKIELKINEKIIIFLFAIDQNVKFHLIIKSFRRLLKIVYRVFHKVLKIMNKFYKIFVVLFINKILIFRHVRKNEKF